MNVNLGQFKKIAAALALVSASVVAIANYAHAEEIQCNGTIGAVTLDNVMVPDGASCTLRGTRLKGTLKVGTNATLIAQGVRINGNLQAEGSTAVTVSGASLIGGSVQIKQGRSAAITGARITGDLQFDEMRGSLIALQNVVGGNLQAFKNAGGLAIDSNRIAENLQCKENTPPPVGGGNTAGSKEDQCAAL